MTDLPEPGVGRDEALKILEGSAAINRAVEMLRTAGVPSLILRQLDAWNGQRLADAAPLVDTDEDLAALFEGIPPEVLARRGVV